MAHPERYEPFSYALVVKALWASGRRMQAALWFYLVQIRTRPWAMADSRGDGAAALHAALNSTLGQPINAWIGGDLAAWKAVSERAVSYERRLPLSPQRPPGISPEAWVALVAKSRADYATQMHNAFATLTPEMLAAQRARNGLPVGPLPQPGPPLPDSWR